MDFYKYHALGNDYIIIDPNKTKIKLNPKRIKVICHRYYGIGSDGILYGPNIEKGKIKLRIFNPDGSEAEKSGNGIRIFAKYLYDSKIAAQKRFNLQTLSGDVTVQILNNDASLIKVDMGKVTFKNDEIPVKGKLREVVNESIKIDSYNFKMTCLSIGNPHCVIPLKEISEELIKNIGPKVENHPLFPNRINVQLLKVIDRQNIKIEIWERGAGYTLASGSSSCAAASVANKLGLVDRDIKVLMPGGTIRVEIDEKNHVHMTGQVSSVAEGNFSEELRKNLRQNPPTNLLPR
ncbi:MAG: diaminopimelate epimerase [candidate division WOR-3 bacterium]|nr:diaminopimelate epimerase [candidate division WOR-3 bacterium]MDH5682877.1 diaminopimelate epimerase [candidate division WOR-3 bacterium]